MGTDSKHGEADLTQEVRKWRLTVKFSGVRESKHLFKNQSLDRQKGRKRADDIESNLSCTTSYIAQTGTSHNLLV